MKDWCLSIIRWRDFDSYTMISVKDSPVKKLRILKKSDTLSRGENSIISDYFYHRVVLFFYNIHSTQWKGSNSPLSPTFSGDLLANLGSNQCVCSVLWLNNKTWKHIKNLIKKIINTQKNFNFTFTWKKITNQNLHDIKSTK